jgi:hypothetical protein
VQRSVESLPQEPLLPAVQRARATAVPDEDLRPTSYQDSGHRCQPGSSRHHHEPRRVLRRDLVPTVVADQGNRQFFANGIGQVSRHCFATKKSISIALPFGAWRSTLAYRERRNDEDVASRQCLDELLVSERIAEDVNRSIDVRSDRGLGLGSSINMRHREKAASVRGIDEGFDCPLRHTGIRGGPRMIFRKSEPSATSQRRLIQSDLGAIVSGLPRRTPFHVHLALSRQCQPT